MAKVTLGDLIGKKDIEDFQDFDLSEVQNVLNHLAKEDPFDIAHCQWLQQRALYGADLLIDMNAKMIKTIGFIEARLNSVKNKCALDYKPEDDKIRITAEMRKAASESDPKVEDLNLQLAKAKGAKQALEKKLDLVLKSHYHFKSLCDDMKQGIISGVPKAVNHSEEAFRKAGW